MSKPTDLEATAVLEIKRLRDLADEVEAKIERYKDDKPGLAKVAKESATLYREAADNIEKEFFNG